MITAYGSHDSCVSFGSTCNKNPHISDSQSSSMLHANIICILLFNF